MLTDWSVNGPASSPPQEGFSGLIERITFHSEETGFAVLRIRGSGSECAEIYSSVLYAIY